MEKLKSRKRGRNSHWPKLGILSLLLLTFLACSDLRDIEDVEFISSQKEYALPLINTSISLLDVFEGQDIDDTDLIINPDSSLLLKYSGDVLSQTAGELFPDVPGGLPFDIRNKQDTIPLPFMRLILNKASLTGDTLAFAIVSDLEEDVRVRVRVPSLLKNGQPLEVERTLTYEGSLPVTEIVFTTMDGLSLELYENSLIVEYEAWDLQGNVVEIEGVSLVYNVMSYSYLEGFFTKNDVNIPGDEIDIEVYDSWIDGRLYFAEPKVTVQVDNSFGFPVRANINYLRVIGRNGQMLDLESPINDQIDFLYPELNEIGEVKTNIIRYDETNSNIEQILNIQPVRLEYDIDAVANPDQDSTIIGFVTDSSLIRINVTVELPVMGWANEFQARDTVEFDIDTLSDVDEAEFKLVIDNGMPLTLTSQIIFTDSSFNTIDSLFTTDVLTVESAAVDARGLAVDETRTIKFETMDSQRLERLGAAKHAILEVSFLTANAPDQIITIDANDRMDIKLGAKIKTQ